jgi:hypothetical protein
MAADPNPAGDRGDAPYDDGLSLHAVVEEYDDAPDECTIYPREANGVDRMATWISAREPAFVDLRKTR